MNNVDLRTLMAKLGLSDNDVYYIMKSDIDQCNVRNSILRGCIKRLNVISLITEYSNSLSEAEVILSEVLHISDLRLLSITGLGDTATRGECIKWTLLNDESIIVNMITPYIDAKKYVVLMSGLCDADKLASALGINVRTVKNYISEK